MKTHPQMVPLDSDTDEIIEAIKKRTGQTKRHIANHMIRTAARRRRIPIVETMQTDGIQSTPRRMKRQ